MGLPDDNAKGYADGSPINFAQNLKGNLLIVQGTGDDNVHYQNLEQLADRLISYNKQFSMMAYPDRTHGISEKPNTRLHLFTMMTDYLHQHLPAGNVRNDPEEKHDGRSLAPAGPAGRRPDRGDGRSGRRACRPRPGDDAGRLCRALVTLFQQWRAFEGPAMNGDVPDRRPGGDREEAAALPSWRAPARRDRPQVLADRAAE